MKENWKTAKHWPHWAHKNRREWARDVRKRWVAYRKAMLTLRFGCSFYPESVNLYIPFDEQDAAMKEFYKGC